MWNRPKKRCAKWNRSSTCRHWLHRTLSKDPSPATAFATDHRIAMASTTSTPLESLPVWARELSEKYYSGVTSMFVLHGNVRDLAPWKSNGATEFLPLQRFLREALFGGRDL